VGASYALFGEHVWAARLPALLSGVALVAAVFGWVRPVIGRGAAWIAGLGLALAPVAIDLSQMARFYTFQALALWLVAIGMYTLLLNPGGWRKRMALIVGVVVAAMLARHVQQTSLIALAAIGVWSVAALVGHVLRWHTPVERRRSALIVAGLGVIGVVGLIVAFSTGWAWQKLESYRWVAAWAAPQQDEVGYYHHLFIAWYQAFWYLLPAAMIVALARFWWPANFCITIFALVFVGHSFGGMKAERYIFYAMPYLMIIWAMALTAVAPLLRRQLLTVMDHARIPGRWRRLRHGVAGLVLVGLLGFWVYNTPATFVTARLIGPGPIEPTPYLKSRWDRAVPQLEKHARTAEVMLTTSPVKAIYYLDRNPIGLSATHVRNGEQFTRNARTGRPMISSPDAVKTVMQRHRTGLIVADVNRWRKTWGVPKETVRFIEQRAQRLSLPDRSGVVAFKWDKPTVTASKGEDAGNR
jgi:hypothetical protein